MFAVQLAWEELLKLHEKCFVPDFSRYGDDAFWVQVSLRDSVHAESRACCCVSWRIFDDEAKGTVRMNLRANTPQTEALFQWQTSPLSELVQDSAAAVKALAL